MAFVVLIVYEIFDVLVIWATSTVSVVLTFSIRIHDFRCFEGLESLHIFGSYGPFLKTWIGLRVSVDFWQFVVVTVLTFKKFLTL